MLSKAEIDIKLNIKRAEKYMSFFISGLLVLTCFSTLLDKDYDYDYAMKQLPKEILDELKKDGDDNLFTIDMFTVPYGYKAFYLGAYPLNADEEDTAYYMQNYADEESISNIINNYGLDKFIVTKYNTLGYLCIRKYII